MKRHRISHVLLLILVFVLNMLMISCQNDAVSVEKVEYIEKELKKEEEKNKTYDMDGGEARLYIGFHLPWDDGKALSSNHDNTYEYFLLTTKYLSERRDGSTITGEFTDLKLTANGDGGRENVDIGWFTQGKWSVNVKALNREGDVLYLGGWEGYISAGTTSSVVVSMEENDEDVGYFALDVVSITLPLPRIVITYSKIWEGTGEHVLLDTGSDGRGLQMTNNSNGYTVYTTPNISLPAGAYWIKVQLWSGEELFSGEVLDTYIVPKKTTTISGEFTITGLAEFLRVVPGQEIKFTEACEEMEIPAGNMITGFHLLGNEGRIDFPYSNDTENIQYIIPEKESVSTYFTNTNGTISGTGYPYKYVGFSKGYADSPIEIGANTFGGTSSARRDLRAIYAPDVVTFGSNSMSYTNLDDIVFGTIAKIDQQAFKGSGLEFFEEVKFSNTVQIGAEAFADSAMKYVDIPAGATLSSNAFKNCTELYRVSFLGKVIPSGCFEGDVKLTDLVFGDVTEIQSAAFKGCVSLTTLELPQTLKIIGERAFENCEGLKLTLNIPASVNKIDANAFKGTKGLSEIYLNAVCGDITGEPWGATCDITWWAYKLFFNSNLPFDYVKAEGEEEFPQIAEKNGIKLQYPIDDPKYRLIAYNDVVGATLDGYSLPIPIIDGYALRGWFTEPADGDEITQLTVNTKRTNWTVYAHWVRGLLTIVFSGGRGGDSNTGISTETYRMVRYQGYYSRVGEEDEIDDHDKQLPTASIAGRDFLGWYMVEEPMIPTTTSPNETAQNELYTKSIVELKKVAAEQEFNQDNLTLVIDKTIDGIRLRTPVFRKKSHTVYAHYRDHRYTVQFDINLPTNVNVYGTRDGVNVSGTYKIPASYTVVYNQPYNKAWDPSRMSSPDYRGVTQNLPDLNSNEYKLDNYWFVGWYLEPECINRVYNSTKVAAQSKNGVTITLYAKWIGKEKQVSYLSKYKNFPTDTTFQVDTIETVTQRFTAPNNFTNNWRSYFNKRVMPGKEQEIGMDIGYAMQVVSRTGYDFLGWYTGFDESKNLAIGTQVIDGNSFTGSPTEVTVPGEQKLYALWKARSYTLTFNYMDDNVTSPTTKTVTYDSKYGDLPVPSRTGFIFTGWYITASRPDGYNYTDAQITKDTYVRTASNHTLYAGWTAVKVIDGNVTTYSSSTPELSVTKDFIPKANNGYYGSGSSNIETETIPYKTICSPTRIGVYNASAKTWSDSPSLDLIDTTLTISEMSFPKNTLSWRDTKSGTGSGTLTISTTSISAPGNQTLKISTAHQGHLNSGVYNANFRGYVAQITLKAENTLNPGTYYYENVAMQCRESMNIYANYVAADNSQKFTHYTQCAIDRWEYIDTTSSNNGEALSYTAGGSQCLVKSKYEPQALKIRAVGRNNKNATITINVNVPKDSISVGKNSTAPSFISMVDTIYTNNATARKQWMITGFGQWEGTTDRTSINATYCANGGSLWYNNTGHTVYLYPYIETVISTASTTCTTISSKNGNAYVSYPTNVGTIGNGSKVFTSSCRELYIASDSNTNIGANAFNNAGITDLHIEKIGEIGSNAFQNNSALPNFGNAFKTITKIGSGAFKSSFKTGNDINVDLSNCTAIGESAFEGAGIASVKVYSKCETVSKAAFKSCNKLNSITIDSKTIGESAFESSSISSPSLSNTVTIGNYAFRSCSALASITIPNTCTSIGTEAFKSDGALTKITNFTSESAANNMSLTSIGTSAFESTGLTGGIILPSVTSSVGASAFKSTNISSVTFGSSISSIGNEAFYGCGNLTTVDFLKKAGSGFNDISKGSNIWDGCNITIARINRECFAYDTGSSSTNSSGTKYYFNPGYGVSFSWSRSYSNQCCTGGHYEASVSIGP